MKVELLDLHFSSFEEVRRFYTSHLGRSSFVRFARENAILHTSKTFLWDWFVCVCVLVCVCACVRVCVWESEFVCVCDRQRVKSGEGIDLRSETS